MWLPQPGSRVKSPAMYEADGRVRVAIERPSFPGNAGVCSMTTDAVEEFPKKSKRAAMDRLFANTLIGATESARLITNDPKKSG